MYVVLVFEKISQRGVRIRVEDAREGIEDQSEESEGCRLLERSSLSLLV